MVKDMGFVLVVWGISDWTEAGQVKWKLPFGVLSDKYVFSRLKVSSIEWWSD